jgi:hypothetical protein
LKKKELTKTELKEDIAELKKIAEVKQDKSLDKDEEPTE